MKDRGCRLTVMKQWVLGWGVLLSLALATSVRGDAITSIPVPTPIRVAAGMRPDVGGYARPTMAVIQRRDHRVQWFDGRELWTLSMLEPTALGIDAAGHLWVGDASLNALFEIALTPKGLQWSCYDTHGQIDRPVAFAFYESNIFVLDQINGTVWVFGPSIPLRPLITGLINPTALYVVPSNKRVEPPWWIGPPVGERRGMEGHAKNGFRRPPRGSNPPVPAGSAPANLLDLYVTDMGQATAFSKNKPVIRVYRTDLTGATFLRSFGEGLLEFPSALDMDQFGRLLVLDAHLAQILIFDRFTGALLNKIGRYGPPPDGWRLPLDFAKYMGFRLIADTGNDRLVLRQEIGWGYPGVFLRMRQRLMQNVPGQMPEPVRIHHCQGGTS